MASFLRARAVTASPSTTPHSRFNPLASHLRPGRSCVRAGASSSDPNPEDVDHVSSRQVPLPGGQAFWLLDPLQDRYFNVRAHLGRVVAACMLCPCHVTHRTTKLGTWDVWQATVVYALGNGKHDIMPYVCRVVPLPALLGSCACTCVLLPLTFSPFPCCMRACTAPRVHA